MQLANKKSTVNQSSVKVFLWQ